MGLFINVINNKYWLKIESWPLFGQVYVSEPVIVIRNKKEQFVNMDIIKINISNTDNKLANEQAQRG